MGLTTAQRRTLSRKAADNSLEVEDLLKVAVIGGAVDTPFLRALKQKHGWSDRSRVGRSLVVPLGRWVNTVCRFLEDGYGGLVEMAGEDPGIAEFCIGLLEEIRTPQSISALLAIGGAAIEQPSTDIKLAVRMADGFNQLLSFNGAPAIDPAVEREIREFLHRLLGIDLSEEHRASVVCALRGVGDTVSLGLIDKLPPFRGDWAGLEASAARRIEQRARRPGGAGA